jgi:hypothetical protein
MDKDAAGWTFGICLFLAAALALGSGRAMSEGRKKPAAGATRSFLFVARIGSMVGGSTARSCTIYLNDAGLIQRADEETGGILHGLAEGAGDMSSFLREATEETSPPPAAPPANPPPIEHYAARIAITSLSPSGKYRADSYEVPATPPKIAALTRRVETDVRAHSLRAAPAGLYGRARRQLNFDPEIEKLHATFPADQLGSLPLLSSLVTQEMSLVRLGPSGEPGLLTKDLQIVPGRAVRVKVGDLVYVIQAYDFRGPEGRGGDLKRKECE